MVVNEASLHLARLWTTPSVAYLSLVCEFGASARHKAYPNSDDLCQSDCINI